MKKLNWKLFFLFMLLNCVLIIGVIAIVFKKPQFIRMNNAELINTTDSFFNIRLNMTVSNPNFFSVSGKDLAIDFAESGLSFGKGRIAPFYLAKRGESDLSVTLKLNFRQVIQSYNKQTSDTLVPSVLIKGSFMPAFFINEINLKKKVPKRELFKLVSSSFSGAGMLKADSFSIKKVSALESQVDFNLLFTNNFSFDYTIKEINATVYPAKDMHQALGNVSLKQTIVLPSKQKASIPLQLTAKNLAILMAMIKLGRKDFTSFYLSGTTVISFNNEEITLPFDIPFGKKE